jgi:hypothetical protein
VTDYRKRILDRLTQGGPDAAGSDGAATPPASPVAADATFRLNPPMGSAASAFISYDDLTAPCDKALSGWVSTRAHLRSKRQAAIDIVVGEGVGLGDKSIAQAMHAHWSEDHWERHGPPPAPSTVRHWCAALRHGGTVPKRDYVRRAKPVPHGADKPSTSTASAAGAAASGPVAGSAAALQAPEQYSAWSPTDKPVIERLWRRIAIDVGDDLPVRPRHDRIVRRRFVEISGSRIGRRVSIAGSRFRYLGATLGGRHAFAELKEDLPAGTKPAVEVMDGTFQRGRFRRR